jgi:aminoglycoside phosphotransferase (APT) family kinase protein
MIAQDKLTAALVTVFQADVTVVARLDTGSSSNEVYHVQAAGEAYIVKAAKAVREELSPFWQQMAALFGSTIRTQLAGLPSLIDALQRQSPVPAPQLRHIEPDSATLGAPFTVVTYLPGATHEADEFPPLPSLHEELGAFVGALHAQKQVGFGCVGATPLTANELFGAHAIATMQTTIAHYWPDDVAVRQHFADLVQNQRVGAVVSHSALIMPDISANQFIYRDEALAGVVDLDAYVIGPRELELTVLELCITEPAAFRRGYERYLPLPRFAPFRSFYRLWLYLNDPAAGVELAEFMERSQHFE